MGQGRLACYLQPFFCFSLFLLVDRRPENRGTLGLGNNQLHCLAGTPRQVFCNGKQPRCRKLLFSPLLKLSFQCYFCVSSELVGK